MKFTFKIVSLLTFFCLSVHVSAADKIIGGEVPGIDHPAYFNTVALIKTADKKVFCTGSIASENLIITAKHCLADKKLGDFEIFIGLSTLDLDSGVTLGVSRFQVRYPTDWEMSFPSGDIAWVEIEGELPPFARPLRVLSDRQQLPLGQGYTLAGHGNKNANGKIEAGEKFFSQTSLSSYEDNARFRDVMVFKGSPGQGACHGDSGGPAYVQLENEVGELEWFLIGVTNGFDLILTPNSMSRTGDPDFPFNVDCSQNENLYTFIGGHGDWIEKSSGISLSKTAPFKERNWEDETEVSTLSEWCEMKSLASPEWNTLKMILDQKVDTLRGNEAREFYLSCEKIVGYLSSLESISFDGELMIEAHYGLKNLKLLPKLRELRFSNIKGQKIDYKSLSDVELDQMSFYNSKVGDLNFLAESVRVKRLDLAKSELESLAGLQAIHQVEEINLASNPLKDASALLVLSNLKALDLGNTKLHDYSFLKSLATLRKLDLKGSDFNRFEILMGLTGLEELTLGGMTVKELDFSTLVNLKHLSLSQMKFESLKFGELSGLVTLEFTSSGLRNTHLEEVAHMTLLEEVMLTFNEISDISVFSRLTELREVNLSTNPIDNLSALAGLSKLEVLRVFRTPIASGQVQRTAQNCPLTGAPVLTRFCSR